MLYVVPMIKRTITLLVFTIKISPITTWNSQALFLRKKFLSLNLFHVFVYSPLWVRNKGPGDGLGRWEESGIVFTFYTDRPSKRVRIGCLWHCIFISVHSWSEPFRVNQKNSDQIYIFLSRYYVMYNKIIEKIFVIFCFLAHIPAELPSEI